MHLAKGLLTQQLCNVKHSAVPEADSNPEILKSPYYQAVDDVHLGHVLSSLRNPDFFTRQVHSFQEMLVACLS